MRRRVVGAALTVIGVLVLLFEPVRAAGGCVELVHRGGVYGYSGVCRTNSWWGLVNWPAGWDKLFLPLLIIGVAFVVTGVVLLVKRSRSRRSPLVG